MGLKQFNWEWLQLQSVPRHAIHITPQKSQIPLKMLIQEMLRNFLLSCAG